MQPELVCFPSLLKYSPPRKKKEKEHHLSASLLTFFFMSDYTYSLPHLLHQKPSSVYLILLTLLQAEILMRMETL